METHNGIIYELPIAPCRLRDSSLRGLLQEPAAATAARPDEREWMCKLESLPGAWFRLPYVQSLERLPVSKVYGPSECGTCGGIGLNSMFVYTVPNSSQLQMLVRKYSCKTYEVRGTNVDVDVPLGVHIAISMK